MWTMGSFEKTIVLVIGMPRSGTTWLGKILDCSPQSLYLHEPDSGTLSPRLPIFIEGTAGREYEEVTRAFFRSLPERAPIRAYTRRPLYKKSYHTKATWMFLNGIALAEKIFTPISRKVLPKRFRLPLGVPIVVKSVESFGRVPLFFRCIDNIKVIYIVRHPCAVRYSLIRGERMRKFKDNTPVSESKARLRQLLALNAARDRGLSLESLFRKDPSERFAYWWVIGNEKAVTECRQVSHAKIIVYEKLCHEPLKVAADVYDFLGWEFSQQVRYRFELMMGRDDDRYYSVFKDPRKTVDAWRHGLGFEESSRIQDVLSSSFLASLWNSSPT